MQSLLLRGIKPGWQAQPLSQGILLLALTTAALLTCAQKVPQDQCKGRRGAYGIPRLSWPAGILLLALTTAATCHSVNVGSGKQVSP